MRQIQALVVIDMLRDFLDPDGALTCGPVAKEVIRGVAAQVREARSKNIPIFYPCDAHDEDDGEFRLYPPHCVKGTPGAEITPELAPEPGDIVLPKRRFSAFFGTDFDLYLRERGVSELILTGVCTDICVMVTAAEAAMRGYRLIVPADAVASFDPSAHQFALHQMAQVFGARVEERG